MLKEAYLTSPFFNRSISIWMPSVQQVNIVPPKSSGKAEVGQTDLH